MDALKPFDGQLTVDQLRQFVPIDNLQTQDLTRICAQVDIETLPMSINLRFSHFYVPINVFIPCEQFPDDTGFGLNSFYFW